MYGKIQEDKNYYEYTECSTHIDTYILIYIYTYIQKEIYGETFIGMIYDKKITAVVDTGYYLPIYVSVSIYVSLKRLGILRQDTSFMGTNPFFPSVFCSFHDFSLSCFFFTTFAVGLSLNAATINQQRVYKANKENICCATINLENHI